ncbi:MAG: 3-phosphoshikimate 1-carboxyvinyltransferase [Candidatus Bathyarchaeota archaeon]|nr:3-phosphoshikimate 1-carboxyvinyltransferase [Candidatus Bathyarchaeum tardum]WGM88953.1 MAG: 3-phosphoshikimate 1-carboxyvinyltransferase [Candidatus Bathyarchaeum tardum]WNZ28810.1 MAG: 3-phosphoshikimate 1-carboxyvinyltransferase [Candidatus Bathyarchaeota archaeon]
MDLTVEHTAALKGVVSAPPSKAYTHRLVIAASLSEGTSKIFNPLFSDDTQATMDAVNALGAETEIRENCWIIHGTGCVKTPKNPIDCRESGSTLRFMVPVAALASGSSKFLFGASFARRPIAPLLGSLKELGIKSTVQSDGSSVVVCGGGIKGGKTSIRGDVSSQFISGLLFACPKASEDTDITVSTPLESKGYVEMTLEVLVKYGFQGAVKQDMSGFWVPSNQSFIPCDNVVPGDFSSAAFLFAAAAVTSSMITVNSLVYQTAQGDRAILGILKDMGASVEVTEESVKIEGKPLTCIDIDAKDIPDLVPVCAVLACYAKGRSTIFNAKRLKYKESDRLNSISTELKKMGADIEVTEDGLTINGGYPLFGATINPHNDHRIAMSCGVAALGAKGETKIQNVECINKSYPQFFNDLRALGGNVVGL